MLDINYMFLKKIIKPYTKIKFSPIFNATTLLQKYIHRKKRHSHVSLQPHSYVTKRNIPLSLSSSTHTYSRTRRHGGNPVVARQSSNLLSSAGVRGLQSIKKDKQRYARRASLISQVRESAWEEQKLSFGGFARRRIVSGARQIYMYVRGCVCTALGRFSLYIYIYGRFKGSRCLEAGHFSGVFGSVSMGESVSWYFGGVEWRIFKVC